MAIDSTGRVHVLAITRFVSPTHSLFVNLDPDGSPEVLPSVQFPVQPIGFAVDQFGNIFMFGNAGNSVQTTTPGAYQPNFGGFEDGFLSQQDPSGLNTIYSTYLGGSGPDSISGLALDSSGNAYLTGSTGSADLPVTQGVFQPQIAGAQNAFVARIVTPPTPTLTPTSTPSTPTSTATATSTATPTPTATPTIPRTPLPTRAIQTTPTITITPGRTPTSTLTPAVPVTATATATITPTPTPTATPVGSVTYSPKDELKFSIRKANTTSGLKFVTMTNPRKNKAVVSITGVALQSPGTSGFNINILMTSCVAGHPVAAGKSCRVAISFAPKASGDATDMLLITGNMTNQGSIALSATARGG